MSFLFVTLLAAAFLCPAGVVQAARGAPLSGPAAVIVPADSSTAAQCLVGATGAATTQTPKAKALVPPPDCNAPVTQADMTVCAHEEFLAASQTYAEGYAELAKALPTAQRERLRRMQKAWLDYRTKACRFESAATVGGSAESTVYWKCSARLTRGRGDLLRRLAATCPEGDIACRRVAH